MPWAAVLCVACTDSRGNVGDATGLTETSETIGDTAEDAHSDTGATAETASEADGSDLGEVDVPDPCATCAPPGECVAGQCQLRIRATFAYERIDPNADWSQLGLPAYVPLADSEVVVADETGTLATAQTAADGHLALAAPWPLPAKAALVVTAVLFEADRPVIAILDGQAIPFPAGNGTTVHAKHVWSWRYDLAEHLDARGRSGAGDVGDLGEIRIPATAGSGALAILGDLVAARAYVLARLLPSPEARGALPTIGVFWSPLAAPPCLSCYYPRGTAPVDLPDGTRFDTALFVAGTDGNALQWTPSLVDHELGHWAMDAFSRMPSAGGSHSWIGAVWPPLAWSEGFATFFAQRALGHPRFFTMQSGTQYWIDLDRIGGPANLASSTAMPFPLPDPHGPLAQPIGEAAVAAILYDLADDVGPSGAPDDDPEALGDEVVIEIGAPRLAAGLVERGAPDGPDLVDYLDGLVCDGVADRATLLPALLGLPYDDGVCEP